MEQIQQELAQRNRVIKWVGRVTIVISAAMLGVMLFLSVADVLGRYLFNYPIEGTFELVGMLMLVIGFLGLGYCQLVKGNIMIDVIINRFSPRVQALLNIISLIMSAVICVLIVWQGWLRAWDYAFKELGGTSNTLHIPFWPFMFLMSISFAWVAVIFIIDIVQAFQRGIKR
jgi:TRAP-type C4-dicarboxylate transport system permease small subunit